MKELIAARYTRRGAIGVGALLLGGASARAAHARAPLSTFAEPTPLASPELVLSPGHFMKTLLRWGDPILPGGPRFDPRGISVSAVEKQFGYNCDYTAFFPLPRASNRSDRGVLTVNHEYTDGLTMFPSCDRLRAKMGLSEAETNIEIASHGVSVVEIARGERGWAPVLGALNRRITGSTPFDVTGPAAGHARLVTSADPTGLNVLGTLGNCAGGITPWGTMLSAEENFHQYFAGPPLADGPEAQSHQRYHVGVDIRFGWSRWHTRFDPRAEPREPNRFGWVVEIDPFDPAKKPVKRTALGRFAHECATCVASIGGEIVVYSGDDGPFEYLYKYVSNDTWKRGAPGGKLLDDGVLFVARFGSDGTMTWLPLVHGEGKLDAAHGFLSQADVLIEARRAADLVGATPLDRPEDVEIDPRTGAVLVALSRNDARTLDRVDAVSPRAPNRYGHLIALFPPRRDHAALKYRWEVLFLGGDPDLGGVYPDGVTAAGWLTNPDNMTVDPSGRLWIATDGQNALGRADGLHLLELGMPSKPRRFLSAPIGAEVTGPTFTPDGKTLFVSIQHPGEGTSFARPSTRWPDFDPDVPPRPSVIAIERDDGGPLG